MIKFSLISILVVMIFITGCATMSSRDRGSSISSKQLEVAAFLKFDDVPIPNGFNFVARESFAFQTQDFRVGLLRYEGKANPDEVVLFYKEQMPLYNWRTVNVIEYDRRVLNFEKDNQNAIITIDAQGSKVALTLAVSPRTEGSEIFEK